MLDWEGRGKDRRTFELLGSLRIVLVLVGMPLQRRLAICFLDLILRRGV
jgi:hypothetical protein